MGLLPFRGNFPQKGHFTENSHKLSRFLPQLWKQTEMDPWQCRERKKIMEGSLSLLLIWEKVQDIFTHTALQNGNERITMSFWNVVLDTTPSLAHHCKKKLKHHKNNIILCFWFSQNNVWNFVPKTSLLVFDSLSPSEFSLIRLLDKM